MTREWAKRIIENPENLLVRLDDAQEEVEQENQALFERLSIIEEQMTQCQNQLDRLLDLYSVPYQE